MLPLSVPPDGGLKLTFATTLWPATSVNGIVNPLIAKSLPFTIACEIVRFDPPGFVSVADSVCVVPTGTLPKVMLEGVTVSCPGLAGFPDEPEVGDALKPWQSVVARARRRKAILLQRASRSFTEGLFFQPYALIRRGIRNGLSVYCLHCDG